MITRKDLIKAQQGEIDAVVLYKKMAERVGKKTILKIMSSSETKALDTYKPFVEQYPELEPMRQDEGRHGRILMELSQKV